MKPLSEISLVDPDVVTSPYDYYARMRAEEPVHFDEKAMAFLVTKYDDVQQALRMTDALSNKLGFEQAHRAEFQDELDAYMEEKGWGPHLSSDNFQVDPPEHSRRRALVDQAFTAQRVAGMEPHIEGIFRDLMDGFIANGKTDLVVDYAIPGAIYVIADLLGVPRERRDDVKRWSDAAVAPLGRGLTKEAAYKFADDMIEMQNFLHSQFEERRQNSRDDMLADLVAAELEGGEKLSDKELISCGVGLLAAGNETTRNGIAWGALLLAQNPDMVRELREAEDQNKALMRFVEEVLRVQSPVPQLPRIAIKDCEIGGTAIPAGSPVYICFLSANRDEEKFEQAHVCQHARENAGRHIAFGAGIHRCIGAMLARMEMKCAFREIINRMDDLKLTVADDEVNIWGTFVFRGPRELPVQFKARS